MPLAPEGRHPKNSIDVAARAFEAYWRAEDEGPHQKALGAIHLDLDGVWLRELAGGLLQPHSVRREHGQPPL